MEDSVEAGNRSPRFVALVPARTGSKGLPGKNFRIFRDKSLVQLAIESATQCKQISMTILSSDDQSAESIAQASGAIFAARSTQAASDTATASDVVNDVLAQIPHLATEEDTYLVYLQPTSPLRTAQHVAEAIEAMLAAGAHAAVSVKRSPVSAFKLVTLDEGRLVALHGDGPATANRLELPPTYLPNGAVYVFRVSDFLESGGIPISGAIGYLMPEDDSIDIDSESDWQRLMKR